MNEFFVITEQHLISRWLNVSSLSRVTKLGSFDTEENFETMQLLGVK